MKQTTDINQLCIETILDHYITSKPADQPTDIVQDLEYAFPGLSKMYQEYSRTTQENKYEKAYMANI